MGCPIYFNYQVPDYGGMETIGKIIGKRIQARRKDAGLKQTELAAKVGLDQSTVSDIENGAGFSATVLIALSKALRVTPEHIMDGGTIEDMSEGEIISIYRNLEPLKRETLLQMVRGLAPKEIKPPKTVSGNRKQA